MPTPVGHALAGLATAWFSDAARRRTDDALTAACVFAAVVPDIDIMFRSHRTYTHSVGAALIAGIVATALARRRRRWPRLGGGSSPDSGGLVVGVVVAVAYATHVLLDWLARDSAPPFGLMALWPFSTRFYLSHVDMFLEVSRRYWKPSEFILGNLKAMGWEVVVLGPIVLLAWALGRRVT
jgi:LexA-binding, inner membrane-associated putative hydrolase